MSEWTIASEYAIISPHERNKNGMGYVICPQPDHSHLLTDEEMSFMLAIYSDLIKRKELSE